MIAIRSREEARVLLDAIADFETSPLWQAICEEYAAQYKVATVDLLSKTSTDSAMRYAQGACSAYARAKLVLEDLRRQLTRADAKGRDE